MGICGCRLGEGFLSGRKLQPAVDPLFGLWVGMQNAKTDCEKWFMAWESRQLHPLAHRPSWPTAPSTRVTDDGGRHAAPAAPSDPIAVVPRYGVRSLAGRACHAFLCFRLRACLSFDCAYPSILLFIIKSVMGGGEDHMGPP